MSTVEPSALVIFSLRYLPSPSCVMPRWTGMPRCGTSSVNLIVLFWPDQIASERSLPTLLGVDVERRRELDVADVVAAEVDVHEAGDGLVRVGVPVVVDALDEGVGAVADADDGDAHLLVLVAASAVRGRRVADVLKIKFVNLRLGRCRAHSPAGAGCVTRRRRRARAASARGRCAGAPSRPTARRARRRRARARRAPKLVSSRPADRMTTRTARSAMPTLHSTPSASARARV